MSWFQTAVFIPPTRSETSVTIKTVKDSAQNHKLLLGIKHLQQVFIFFM